MQCIGFTVEPGGYRPFSTLLRNGTRWSSRSMAYSTLPIPSEKLLGSKLGMDAMHRRSPVAQSITTTDPLSSPIRRAA